MCCTANLNEQDLKREIYLSDLKQPRIQTRETQRLHGSCSKLELLIDWLNWILISYFCSTDFNRLLLLSGRLHKPINSQSSSRIQKFTEISQKPLKSYCLLATVLIKKFIWIHRIFLHTTGFYPLDPIQWIGLWSAYADMDHVKRFRSKLEGLNLKRVLYAPIEAIIGLLLSV